MNVRILFNAGLGRREGHPRQVKSRVSQPRDQKRLPAPAFVNRISAEPAKKPGPVARGGHSLITARRQWHLFTSAPKRESHRRLAIRIWELPHGNLHLTTPPWSRRFGYELPPECWCARLAVPY